MKFKLPIVAVVVAALLIETQSMFTV